MRINPLTIHLPSTSGIYRLDFAGGENVYVGSSTSVRRRVSGHLSNLKLGKFQSSAMRRAFRKHGRPVASIIESCETSLLKEREQYWVDQLRPSVNGTSYVYRPGSGQGWEILGVRGRTHRKIRRLAKLAGLRVSEFMDRAVDALREKGIPGYPAQRELQTA